MNKVAFLPPWSPLPSYEPSGKNNREKKKRETVNSKTLENKPKKKKKKLSY